MPYTALAWAASSYGLSGAVFAQSSSGSTPIALPEIVVNQGTGPVAGYVADKSETGTKTDTPLLVTPQSVSIVTKDELTARGAESLPQALLYTPSVTLGRYGSNSLFDNPVVRGFTVPTYTDGLRMPGDVNSEVVPFIDIYGIERLEVLRGSSSALYGQTPPGGLINVTSKRPTATPEAEVGVRIGSYNQKEGFFDVGGPVDKQGTYLYRFVGLGQLSDTQIDHVQNNKYYFAPSFTFQPDLGTSLTFLASSQRDGGHGYQQYVPAVGSALSNPDGRIPYSRYLGEPGLDGRTVGYDAIGYAFEHRFNDALKFRQNARISQLDAAIDAVTPFGPVGPDFETVPRSMYQVRQQSRQAAIDSQLQADIATGPITHKALAGVDFYDTSSDNFTAFGPAATPINIFAPVYGAPQNNPLSPIANNATNLIETGLYVQDQAKLDHLRLTLTGRFDNAQSRVNDSLAATDIKRTDDATTGRAGLSYLFDSGVAPYVSYATSFQPTAGLDRLGDSFRPTTGVTKEAGIKYEPSFIKALFTAAYFDTDQKNVLTTDPVNALFQVQTGAVNVKGVEFEAKASVNKSLDITASYSRLDPRITSTNDGTAGNYQPNIALDDAALWAMYTFRSGPIAGLGLGGGVRHVGRSYADDANTFATPSYTTFDAAIAYDFGALRPSLHGLSARVNITNVANTYYVTNCFGSSFCGLGIARTVLGTVSYRW